MKVNDWTIVVRQGGCPIWTDIQFNDGRGHSANLYSLSAEQIFDLEHAAKRAADHLRAELEKDRQRELARIWSPK